MRTSIVPSVTTRLAHIGRYRRPSRLLVGAAVVAVALLVPSSAVAQPCWQPPVAAPVSDPFRAPVCQWCPGNRGIEYATRPGTTVRSVGSGSVSYAGTIAGTRYVVVRLANGWRVTYGDLASSDLRTGDLVLARSAVGVASTRLHFGVRVGPRYVDPDPYLGEWTHRVRLIPLNGTAAAPAGRPRLTCRR
jgi:murein DD-endopeptidase MepM/ murein hydrolase activator NlpD